jgi:hypothetical protein
MTPSFVGRGAVANLTRKSFDFFVSCGLNRFTDLNAMQLVVRIPQSSANAGSRAGPRYVFRQARGIRYPLFAAD